MIIAELGGEAYGYRHFHLESVGSTNEVLVELAREGDAGKLWLTAGEQTRGKGSRGRDWESVPGNLYASLLLRDPCPKKLQHQLTFVAALSASSALERASDHKARISLKWPNDLFLEGKKCGGILLESGEFKRLPYVIIGMGINCVSYPEQTLHPSTSLKNEGFEMDPMKLFDELSAEFARQLEFWDGGENFDGVRERWLERAHGSGKQVTVEIPGAETIEGRFASIDAQGYMVVETSDGKMKKISTADIFFAPSTPEGT